MSVIIVLKDDLIKRKSVQPQHCQRQLDNLRNKATSQPYLGVGIFLLIKRRYAIASRAYGTEVYYCASILECPIAFGH